MAPSEDTDGLTVLRASVDSTTALAKNFQTALQNRTPPTLDMADPPNPLCLLSDSASILKAQTTKLSLLILNKPFTPSAITFIINSLSNQCLPALMSALELCTPAQWTSFLQQHLRASLSHIMGQYLDLVASIPTDERGVDTAAGRGVLANTGVLWESCDKLIELASTGLVSLAVQKANAYHSLLQDAITELEEWDPDELVDDNDDDFDSDSDFDSIQDQLKKTHIEANNAASSSGLSNSTVSPPSMTIPQLQTVILSHLRLIRLLYPALHKRRLLTFPPLTSTTPVPTASPSQLQIKRLDSLMNHLRQFSEEADEAAGALYEGKEGDVNSRLRGLRKIGISCIEESRFNWGGKEDEFSEWGDKWAVRMNEKEKM